VDPATAAPAAAPAVVLAELREEDEGVAFGFFDDVPEAAVDAPAAPEPLQAIPARVETPGDQTAPLAAAAVAPAAAAVAVAAVPAAAAAAAQQESSSIRVSVEKVDEIINLVGQLVITRAMLAQLAASGGKPVEDLLSFSLEQLDRNTRDLQEAAMAIRMMPISAVFNRFPRLLRDLASRLGKQVDLRLVGETTELDKGLIEKIVDPLTHLVRNSLDHGIELPHDRIAVGKPATGTITLRASHQGGNVVIEVSDDGRGLNRERILSIARQRGVAVPDNPTDTDVWNLIFEAGFSTAEKVTDVSGRGVGMDVVRSNIHALGGRVDIESTAGTGTRMTVRLPLTLAILDGLSVSCGGEIFILPLTCIIESLRPAPGTVKTVAGRGSVVHIRGEYLPVIALHEVLGIPNAVTVEQDGIFVILDTEGARIALFVDALVGQHQVVIKSLETNYRRVPGISGATIMGDGRVALIIDAQNLARIAAQRD
jgi:two-component system chemotaxis sensor kinase CheA